MTEEFDRSGVALLTANPTTVYQVPGDTAGATSLVLSCLAAHVADSNATASIELRIVSFSGQVQGTSVRRALIGPGMAVELMPNRYVLGAGERVQAIASPGGLLSIFISVLGPALLPNRRGIANVEAYARFVPPETVGSNKNIVSIGSVVEANVTFRAPAIRIGAVVRPPALAVMAGPVVPALAFGAVASLDGAEFTVSIGLVAGAASSTSFATGADLIINASIEGGIVTIEGAEYTPESVETGTEAPLLGASGAVDFTGWTRIQNANVDDANIEVTGWPFTFTLAGTGYTSGFVGSNSYITFGAGNNQFSSLSASNPILPKIHFGAADNSYQRIYTKSDVTSKNNKVMRIRYEGNGNTSGTIGAPGIVAEFAFFEPALDGTQLIELRIGNHNRTSGLFMIASASSSYASATIAANSSWVFVGDSAGTSWTLTSNRYVA